MTVAGTANMKLDYNAVGKGDGNMCTLFNKIQAEGRAEGREEGRAVEIVEMGREFGLSDADILNRLQEKLNLSLQKAQEYFEIYEKNFA